MELGNGQENEGCSMFSCHCGRHTGKCLAVESFPFNTKPSVMDTFYKGCKATGNLPKLPESSVILVLMRKSIVSLVIYTGITFLFLFF